MDHYPKDVPTSTSLSTIKNVRLYQAKCVAEIGCNKGATSLMLAKLLAEKEDTNLHLFDFVDKVEKVTRQIIDLGFNRVHGHFVSHALHDSYNWNLMHLIQQGIWKFDYVFIDGAHTWNIDALTFFLVDRLLEVGGLIEFDDYNWSIDRSPTLNPRIFPITANLYTVEQIEARQVKMIIDLLVKPDPRYVEITPNRLYRKIA